MKAAVLASLLVLIAGCYRTDSARWLEQVPSWDGTVFKLEGHAEIPTWLLLPNRGPTTFVSYYHRPTGAFWKQGYGYRPLVFDLVKGTPIVILGMDSDGKCYWHGWPTTRLVAYRWTGNGWEETSLSDLPIDKMRANLLTSIYHSRDASKDISGLITLPEKRGRGWLDLPLNEWTVKYGAPCERRVRFDNIGPAPILTGSHGVPIKSSLWGD